MLYFIKNGYYNFFTQEGLKQSNNGDKSKKPREDCLKDSRSALEDVFASNLKVPKISCSPDKLYEDCIRSNEGNDRFNKIYTSMPSRQKNMIIKKISNGRNQ